MVRNLILGISAALTVACQGTTGDSCAGIFTDREGNPVEDLALLSFKQEADLDIGKNKLSLVTIPNDFAGSYTPISESMRDRFHSINRNELEKITGYEVLNNSRLSMKGVEVLRKDAGACAPEIRAFKDYARGYNDIVVQHLLDLWNRKQLSKR